MIEWKIRADGASQFQLWALVLSHNIAVSAALCESYRHGVQYGVAQMGPPQIVRDLFSPGWDVEIHHLRWYCNEKDRALAEACDWIEHDLSNHEAMVERAMTHDREKLTRWRDGLSWKRRDGVGLDDPLDVIECLRNRIVDLTADARASNELRAELAKLVGSRIAGCRTPIGMARHLKEAANNLAMENSQLARERDSLQVRYEATKAALDDVDRERTDALELLEIERRNAR